MGVDLVKCLLHSFSFFIPPSLRLFLSFKVGISFFGASVASLPGSGYQVRISGYQIPPLEAAYGWHPHPPLAWVSGTCKAQSYSRGRGRSHRAQSWMERSRQHSARLPWSAQTARESCAGPAVGLRLPWRSGQAAPQGGVPGYAVPMVQKRPAEAQVPRWHA